jgi:Pyridoxamine 5'-phosphate oxidase
MASWSEFADAAPALAASIRAVFHQYGPGLGYLATVRSDGGPRVHPVAPTVVMGGLYCCVVDTPKRHDLDRDPRFALHSFPAEDSDDEAGVRGTARLVTDPGVIRRVAMATRADSRVEWWLYELRVDSAFYIRRSSAKSIQTWTDPGGWHQPSDTPATVTYLHLRAG